MTIHVHYYAQLRDEASRPHETRETSARTVAQLWEETADEHGFTLDASLIRAAIDDEFCDWNTPLTPGAQVVFMPPVAGG